MYVFVTSVSSGRSQEKGGRNVTVIGFMYKYYFYSLAVEAGFYGWFGRVVGFLSKLSNVLSG